MKLVLDLEQFGVIKKNNIDELLAYATEKKADRFTAYLLDKKTLYLNKTVPCPNVAFGHGTVLFICV